MASTRSAAVIVACAALAGCGGDGDDGAGIGASPDQEEGSPPSAQAEAIAERCSWSHGGKPPSDAEIRQAFVTGLGDGDADRPERILLEASRVRPGQTIMVAVDNRSKRGVLYGAAAELRDPVSGARVPTRAGVIPAIGLSAQSGEVGPCVPLSLRDTTPPGRYRVVLGRASAEIAVGGDPVDEGELTTEGTTPESQVTTLYEPETPNGALAVRAFRSLGKDLFGEHRFVEIWIDRSLDPPVTRLTIHDGDDADRDAFLHAVDASSHLSRSAVALDSTPFSRKDLNRQAKRVEAILNKEAPAGFGFGEAHHKGVIEVSVSEISVETKQQLQALPGPPVKIDIEG